MRIEVTFLLASREAGLTPGIFSDTYSISPDGAYRMAVYKHFFEKKGDFQRFHERLAMRPIRLSTARDRRENRNVVI